MEDRGALIYEERIALADQLLSSLHLVDIGQPDKIYRPERHRTHKLDRVPSGNANLALPTLTLTSKSHGLSATRKPINLQHD